MTVLTVRNLDPNVKTRLRVRAAQHGIAMEEEVRRILTHAAWESPSMPEKSRDLGNVIRARFAGLGKLEIPLRHRIRPPPFFEDENLGS